MHDERETALVVAAHVAATLAAAEEIDQMHTAMERRTTIGVTIGLVMQRYDLDRTTAFEMLRRLSQQRNQKLHEMAASLSRDGALGAAPAAPGSSVAAPDGTGSRHHRQ
ncbi:MAG TPA: ANTAR domain-containing protein [Nocardioides sp.]